MDALYFLIPAALVLSVCGLSLFIWAVRHGQFDDLDSPAWKIFLDV
ncbi:MAG: cbb3-type cytochrome oxidase assembly protein CcoS [Vulcanimicrobiota bacterium]